MQLTLSRAGAQLPLSLRCCIQLLLQALCAEASLAALRRVYPQVYDSDCKLLINPAAVVVGREDFMTAMQGGCSNGSSSSSSSSGSAYYADPPPFLLQNLR
jgi:hypothetical protein